jgi:hypothetical protein
MIVNMNNKIRFVLWKYLNEDYIYSKQKHV